MGTLGDEGAELLLDCPIIKKLDVLNISGTYVSSEIFKCFLEQNIPVLFKHSREDEDEGGRYCAVAE